MVLRAPTKKVAVEAKDKPDTEFHGNGALERSKRNFVAPKSVDIKRDPL
jgi:hypothetical protein